MPARTSAEPVTKRPARRSLGKRRASAARPTTSAKHAPCSSAGSSAKRHRTSSALVDMVQVCPVAFADVAGDLSHQGSRAARRPAYAPVTIATLSAAICRTPLVPCSGATYFAGLLVTIRFLLSNPYEQPLLETCAQYAVERCKLNVWQAAVSIMIGWTGTCEHKGSRLGRRCATKASVP